MRKLWRVVIRVAPPVGKRKGTVHELFVLAAKEREAKALACAEWGLLYRTGETVVSVTAEPERRVVRGSLSLTDAFEARPASIPSTAAIEEAEATLRAEEGL